MQVEQDTH